MAKKNKIFNLRKNKEKKTDKNVKPEREFEKENIEKEIEILRQEIETYYLEHPENDPALPDKIFVKDMNDLEEKITEHIPKKVVEDEIIIKNIIEKEEGAAEHTEKPVDFSRVEEFELPNEFRNQMFVPNEVITEEVEAPEKKVKKGKGELSETDGLNELELFFTSQQAETVGETSGKANASMSNGTGAVEEKGIENSSNNSSNNDIDFSEFSMLFSNESDEGSSDQKQETFVNKVYTRGVQAEGGTEIPMESEDGAKVINAQDGIETAASKAGDETSISEKELTNEVDVNDLFRDLFAKGELELEIYDEDGDSPFAATDVSSENGEDTEPGTTKDTESGTKKETKNTGTAAGGKDALGNHAMNGNVPADIQQEKQETDQMLNKVFVPKGKEDQAEQEVDVIESDEMGEVIEDINEKSKESKEGSREQGKSKDFNSSELLQNLFENGEIELQEYEDKEQMNPFKEKQEQLKVKLQKPKEEKQEAKEKDQKAKEKNQELQNKNQKLREENQKTKEDQKLREENQKRKEDQKLRVENQKTKEDRKLRVENQKSKEDQKLREENQKTKEDRKLREENQKTKEDRKLRVENQKTKEDQKLREENQKSKEENQELQNKNQKIKEESQEAEKKSNGLEKELSKKSPSILNQEKDNVRKKDNRKKETSAKAPLNQKDKEKNQNIKREKVSPKEDISLMEEISLKEEVSLKEEIPLKEHEVSAENKKTPIKEKKTLTEEKEVSLDEKKEMPEDKKKNKSSIDKKDTFLEDILNLEKQGLEKKKAVGQKDLGQKAIYQKDDVQKKPEKAIADGEEDKEASQEKIKEEYDSLFQDIFKLEKDKVEKDKVEKEETDKEDILEKREKNILNNENVKKEDAKAIEQEKIEFLKAETVSKQNEMNSSIEDALNALQQYERMETEELTSDNKEKEVTKEIIKEVGVPTVEEIEKEIKVSIAEEIKKEVEVSIAKENTKEIEVLTAKENVKEIEVPTAKGNAKEIEVPIAKGNAKEIEVSIAKESAKEIEVPTVEEIIKEMKVPIAEENTKEIEFPIVEENAKEVKVSTAEEIIKEVEVPVIEEVIKEVEVPVVEEVIKEKIQPKVLLKKEVEIKTQLKEVDRALDDLKKEQEKKLEQSKVGENPPVDNKKLSRKQKKKQKKQEKEAQNSKKAEVENRETEAKNKGKEPQQQKNQFSPLPEKEKAYLMPITPKEKKESFFAKLLRQLQDLFKKKETKPAKKEEKLIDSVKKEASSEKLVVYNKTAEAAVTKDNYIETSSNISSENYTIIEGIVTGSVTGAHVKLNSYAIVKKDISVTGTCICMPMSTVMGNIAADEVIIESTVRGNIRAGKSVIIKNDSIVFGDIYAPMISVEQLAIVEGGLYYEEVESVDERKMIHADI
jgi:hypothetical protein